MIPDYNVGSVRIFSVPSNPWVCILLWVWISMLPAQVWAFVVPKGPVCWRAYIEWHGGGIVAIVYYSLIVGVWYRAVRQHMTVRIAPFRMVAAAVCAVVIVFAYWKLGDIHTLMMRAGPWFTFRMKGWAITGTIALLGALSPFYLTVSQRVPTSDENQRYNVRG